MVVPDLQKIAQWRSECTGDSYMAWLNALSEGEQLLETGDLSGQDYEVLAEACSSPEKFSLVVEAVELHGREHPDAESGYDLLAKAADGSPFGLDGWVDALDYFYAWLADRHRTVQYETMLHYLNCVSEAVMSRPQPHQPTLTEALEEMLDEYGFQDD